MPEFAVKYQDTPYNYTSPRMLIIEAEGRGEAFVTAANELLRRGYAVSTHSSRDLDLTPEEEAVAAAAGLPDLHGGTNIREITPYNVQVPGKVLGG